MDVLGWAASEEFLDGVKHDLVYELLERVLQVSFGPFVLFSRCLGQPERNELQ